MTNVKTQSCRKPLSAAATLAARPRIGGFKQRRQPIKTDNTVHFTQDKPLRWNLNTNANLNVVVTDARQICSKSPVSRQFQQCLGPPTLAWTSTPRSRAHRRAAISPGAAIPVSSNTRLFRSNRSRTAFRAPLAQVDDLKASMKERHAQVRALLDSHNAGEAHTGLLESRGTLTADEQKLLTAENDDRTALYKIEAEKRGEALDQVALHYYLARLNYAKKGDWYEKFNKEKEGSGEWMQWDK